MGVTEQGCGGWRDGKGQGQTFQVPSPVAREDKLLHLWSTPLGTPQLVGKEVPLTVWL